MSQAVADGLVVEADALFREEQFAEAVLRFGKATEVFPAHAQAWKGLGHALLCLGKSHDAARAFDKAIGLAPGSATALWGGAVAHAEVGNKVVARDYLRRTLELQPSWEEMARGVPQLAGFLQLSHRTAEDLRAVFGAFSTRTYRHAATPSRTIEVGRILNQPKFGQWTFVTVGLSDHAWPELGRPRIELALASTIDSDVCGQILANLTFHLSDIGFFPEPTVVVRDVIGALGEGDLSRRLPHVYIAVPRLWAELSLPLSEGPPPVTLAHVIPISEAEYEIWRAQGHELDGAFAARRIDVADLRRPG